MPGERCRQRGMLPKITLFCSMQLKALNHTIEQAWVLLGKALDPNAGKCRRGELGRRQRARRRWAAASKVLCGWPLPTFQSTQISGLCGRKLLKAPGERPVATASSPPHLPTARQRDPHTFVDSPQPVNSAPLPPSRAGVGTTAAAAAAACRFPQLKRPSDINPLFPLLSGVVTCVIRPRHQGRLTTWAAAPASCWPPGK